MKHNFRTVDLDRLAQFWNEFFPARYRIDSDVLRLNTVDCPVFDWGASCVEEADGEILGFIIVKKSPASLYSGSDKDVAHLSAIGFCDANFGVDLLADLKRLLRNRGCSKLVFGQDSGHFFPGCPEDFPSLTSFLTVEGFGDGGVSNDMERDLSDYENVFPVPEGDELRPLETKDIDALDRFLIREFPNRWRYDVMRKVSVEGAGCVFGLFRRGSLEGFALLQDASNRLPIGGAIWRNDLGENWASLGPIGVSKSLRGHGHGNSLLGSALAYQHSKGFHRCIIDWTSLVDFYGKHGFTVARRYHSMWLNLAA